MKTLKLIHNNKIRGDMSHAELIRLAKAFNRATKPVSSIVRLLEKEIVNIDTKLNNTEALYERNKADMYIAALLAERGFAMRLHNLLTETVDVDPAE